MSEPDRLTREMRSIAWIPSAIVLTWMTSLAAMISALDVFRARITSDAS